MMSNKNEMLEKLNIAVVGVGAAAVALWKPKCDSGRFEVMLNYCKSGL
jgi:hypothetical protein